MELQNLIHLDIRTFDQMVPKIKVTVAVNKEKSIRCEEILRKSADALGLKVQSLTCFTLCEGHDRPVKRYKKDDYVPIDSKGQLKPSDSEAEKLNDCLDPDFPADGQYIKLCQCLPHYSAVLIQGCVIESSEGQATPFPESWHVDVVLSRYGLSCFSADQSYKVTWFEVTQWLVNQEKKTLVLTIQEQDRDLICLPLHTDQLDYMFSAMSEMLTLLQRQEKDFDVTFHTDMIQTQDDGSTLWSNGFYDPARADKYRDKL